MASLILLRNDVNTHVAQAIVDDNPGSELKKSPQDLLVKSGRLRINRRTIENALRRRIDNKTWIFLLKHKEGVVKEINDEYMVITDDSVAADGEELLIKFPPDIWEKLEAYCRSKIKSPEDGVLEILRGYFAN